ncbi:MAG: DsbA family protein [Hyphomicrobiales bacterium]
MTPRKNLRRTGLLALLAVAAPMLIASPALKAQNADLSDEAFGKRVRDYLMQNPEVLRDVLQELDKKERDQQAQAVQTTIASKADALYRSTGDLVMGNPKGNVTVVEFMDYNCGYCKRSLPDVMKLIDNDKELRLVIKEFPILGPTSVVASHAALAADKQGKYKEFHLALMEHKGALSEAAIFEIAKSVGLDVDKLKADMQDKAVTERIENNHSIANALGIDGTPAFIIDQQLIPGAMGYDSLAEAVSQVRSSGGCKYC